MVLAAIVLLSIMLVLSHTLVRTHPVLASASTTAPDGTVSSIDVYFFRTVIGTAGFYPLQYDTGLRIETVTGVYATDQPATDSAISDMIQSSNWAPLRHDDHLVRVVKAMQSLLPLAIALLGYRLLRADRTRLNNADRCLNCAYSLQGIEQSRCPECGQSCS